MDGGCSHAGREDVHLPDVTFDTKRAGPQNMPECFDASTRELDYLNLFLDGEFWELLCTNLYAAQVKALHPNRYYAKSYKSASVPEMKAFVGLRLMMEKTVVKPWYENYWKGEAHNFMSFSPGFRDVMERDRFLVLWTFLHLVDQQDPNINKSDKIYKVRPMLEVLLPRFRQPLQPRAAAQPRQGHDAHQERAGHQTVHQRQTHQVGHQVFNAVNGQNGLHHLRRDLHRQRSGAAHRTPRLQ